MGRTNCSICRHSDRASIDIAMLAGESDSAIARRWNLTQTAATIHRAKHLVTSPAQMTPALREAHETALARFAISSKVDRVSRIQSLIDRMDSLMASRARAYSHVPGGDSGLLVARQREVAGEVVHEEVLDAMVLKEYRELLRQAAGELGQWDVTGKAAREDTGTSITVIQAVSGPGEPRQVIAADARPGAAKPLPALESPRPQGLISALNDAFRQHSITSETIESVAVPVADEPVAGASDGGEGGE